MKTTSTLAIFLLVLLFSCNVEENDTGKITSENNLKSLFDFDNYGTSHNLAMDYIATMPNFNNATLQDIYNFADTYTDAYFTNQSCNCDDWQTQEMHMNMIETILEDTNNGSNILLNMNVINPQNVPLTDILLNILDNAASYENNTYKSVSDFTSEIEQFENFVINNYVIDYDAANKTGNYAATILAACSIAKNSYSYWINATLDTSHPWNYRLKYMSTYNGGKSKTTNLQKNIFGDIWRGIKRAGADVIGFLVGGKCGPVMSPEGRDLRCAIKHSGKKSSGVR
jgi:hypothetical protein